MITDLLLGFLNFIWYGGIEFFWVKDLPFIPLSSFTAATNWFSISMLPTFHFLNFYLPMVTIFWCFIGYIILHITVFSFQAARFIIKLFAGARVK
jgi:hypothetical protein